MTSSYSSLARYGSLGGNNQNYFDLDADKREKKAWTKNLAVVCAFCLLCSLSQWMFTLLDMHNSKLFLTHNGGLVICALAVGYYTVSTSHAEKDVLLGCGVTMALGTSMLLITGVHESRWLLVWSGRVIAGSGAAGLVVCRAYVARITHPKERLKYMTVISACEYTGFSIPSILCEQYSSDAIKGSEYVVISAAVLTLVAISFFDLHVQNASDTLFVRPYQHFNGFEVFVKSGIALYFALNFVAYGMVNVAMELSHSSWYANDTLRLQVSLLQIATFLFVYFANSHIARFDRVLLTLSVSVICAATFLVCWEYSGNQHLASNIYPEDTKLRHTLDLVSLPYAVQLGWLLIEGVAMPLKTALLLSVFSRLCEVSSLPQLDLHMAYLLTAGVAGKVMMPYAVHLLSGFCSPFVAFLWLLLLCLLVIAASCAWISIYHRFKHSNEHEDTEIGTRWVLRPTSLNASDTGEDSD